MMISGKRKIEINTLILSTIKDLALAIWYIWNFIWISHILYNFILRLPILESLVTPHQEKVNTGLQFRQRSECYMTKINFQVNLCRIRSLNFWIWRHSSKVNYSSHECLSQKVFKWLPHTLQQNECQYKSSFWKVSAPSVDLFWLTQHLWCSWDLFGLDRPLHIVRGIVNEI